MNFMKRVFDNQACCSIRFKGIVEEEYRHEMHRIFVFGNWHASKDRVFEPVRFRPEDMKMAPFRELTYPKEWKGCDSVGHEYQNRYNAETGEFVFTCTIWDWNEFENFFVLTLPFIVRKVITCEVWEEHIYGDIKNKTGMVYQYRLKDYKWYKVKEN